MKAIFYDRRNKREVTSEELFATKLVQYVATGDNDDEYIPTGRRKEKKWGESFTEEQFERAKKDGHFKQCGQDDSEITWESLSLEMTPRVLYLTEQPVADLHYKSENCPSYINGDLYTTLNDLVFIRLESK